jgi:hypothetical protein
MRLEQLHRTGKRERQGSLGRTCLQRHDRPAPKPPCDSRKKRTELNQEIPRHQKGGHRKHHVARKPHPLPEERPIIEGNAARVGESVLEHGVELRPANQEEVERNP